MFDSFKKILKDKQPATPGPQDAGMHKRQGKEHVRNGDWDAAIRSYRAALDLNPDDLDATIALAFALMQRNEMRESGELLRHAIGSAPDNADAHYLLGTIARDDNDLPNAIKYLRKAIVLEPRLTDGYRDLAIAYFRSGEVDSAKTTIEQGIAVDPLSPEFRMILGNVLGHAGDHEGALAAYQSGLAILPSSPELHNNLGNVLRAMGRIGAATTSYRTALAYRPDFADAHVNLGNVMRDEGRSSEALAHFRSALAASPDSLLARIAVASVLTALDQPQEALDLIEEGLLRHPDDSQLLLTQVTALAKTRKFHEASAVGRRLVGLAPDLVNAHVELGNVLLHQGEREQAVVQYRRAVELDPGNPVAHLVAALSGDTTERAPDEYVAGLFDTYAEKFDSHLVGTLKYDIPRELAERLRAQSYMRDGGWDVLDLGCGTGLAGAAVSSDVRQIVGIDLSEKMLAKARARNLYARLERADLLTAMKKEPSDSFDVIIAADVFVYIGRLDQLAQEAHRLLRPNGVFAFSVESMSPDANVGHRNEAEEGFHLAPTGRYSHSRQYLDSLAASHQFKVIEITETIVRVNEGKPVPGFVALFRR